MHPTIDDQLAGALRLLGVVAADDELPDRSRETLANVQRLLKQVTRSWSLLPEFYARDNAELTVLLGRLQPRLSPSLAGAVERRLADPSPAGTGVAAAGARNAELRALLSSAMGELPVGSDDPTLRAEVGGYLRRRVAADPA